MGLFDKKPYTTTTVRVGGTKIDVRQVLLKGDKMAPQLVAAAVMNARAWLQEVIPLRRSWQYDEKIKPIFRFFFHTDPTPENSNIVWTVLNNINRGLQGSFGIKISRNDPSTLGYVTGYYSECANRNGAIYHYDEDDGVLWRQGEIHMYRGMLSKGDLSTVTLIHEGGHRFAGLEDFGDEGYFTEDYSGMESYTLPWQKCMRNADSYAAFVYFLANPKIAELRLEKLRERAQRKATLGSGYDLEGAFGMFA